jgi:drug/metabolite transporter (DMT)-like permease
LALSSVVRARGFPYAVWLGTGLVWGTTWVVIRIGVRDLPPLTFAAARTVVAAFVLTALALAFHAPRRPPRRELLFWAVIGVPQLGLPYALIFWAETAISAGLTALLFGTFPTITAIAAHFLLPRERLNARKLAATLLAGVAVAFIVNLGSGAAKPPLVPVLAVLAAATASSIGAVLVRRHGRTTSTLWLTAIQVTTGASLLVVLAVALERGAPVNVTPTAVASVLYLALVVTVGCYLGLFWLLKRLDATFVSMGVIFETVMAVLLGAALLNESLGPRIMLGLALVGVSVALVTGSREQGAGNGERES